MGQSPVTANATYCATLVDQWVRDGLTHAYAAPGSRSTPLALALAQHPAISLAMFHDERSAAFAALGHGLATGRPAVVTCSSGTAGAHFFAAVIEADLAAVPMLVVTADRPPELWGRGAPQTIDQAHLYGNRVRVFMQPGPADELEGSQARSVARKLWSAAMGPTPGPAHLNQSFRDPLTGRPGELSEALPTLEAAVRDLPDAATLDEIVERCTGARGVIIAGRGQSDPATVLALAARLDWPVIADHRSGCRAPDNPQVVRRFDSLLRHGGFAAAHQPDVVLRLGEIVSSKAVSQWLAATAAFVIASRPHDRLIDPEDIASVTVSEAGLVEALLARLDEERPPTDWGDRWRQADKLADETISVVLASRGDDAAEVLTARAALEAVPTGGALVVASSMPIRDVEWFGQSRSDCRVLSNRGANGIDGTIATAIGVATTGVATVCLLGDVALLHDSTSLSGLADRSLDLTIVVVDNDGGGIFSFLPQHELLSSDVYEPLFGTPHGTDIAALATAHGIDVHHGLAEITPRAGCHLVLVRSDRATNLAVHDELHSAVAEALDATG